MTTVLFRFILCPNVILSVGAPATHASICWFAAYLFFQ